MYQKQFDENQFMINVNGKTYNVTAFCEGDHCSRFKIETACEYLFTLQVNNEGQWQMENDVTPLNESIIEDIGRAIEEHDAA